MKILVGCPISSREWILPTWMQRTETAFRNVDAEFEYIFVVSENDKLTRDCLMALREQYFRRQMWLVNTDEPQRKDVRAWNLDRLQVMVELRNRLLAEVRNHDPDYFLSLDSDILLKEDAMEVALREIPGYDALGFCTYLNEPYRPPIGMRVPFELGRQFTSMGQIVHNRITNRTHYESMINTLQVDCIMAAKLMTPLAYNIDYKMAADGEDIGWCVNCREAGLRLGWAPQAKAKHVFRPESLFREDYRVGF